ncbi:phage holin family protein [Yoonia vestfoldensis]|uniref:Putative actinobacterial Holin-X, holin superfamily III n=1 Tax=Yoonia vestfoldensis TaxID=245188 RepID=A0A1Y0E9L3_9RHOB|nr:phage holin family protein [Yoonia vestfoldensis]ARU00286.1 putative actinobacterial Holin-X, holin superfamily III [Yoonia vestfoldensis]
MTNEKTAGAILNEAMTRVSNLVRGEIDLARAELNENVRGAGTAIGMIVAAAVVALTALNVLTAALVAALAELGIPGGWSALIVGVALALIAYLMLQKGKSDLQLASLAPTRTAANVKRDAQTVKESYND